MQKRLLIFSGFSGAVAVALGALGAHFLKSKVEAGFMTESGLQAFETAVKYHMYHSLALLAIAALFTQFNEKTLTRASYCFIAGMILFSGSLYLLSTGGLFGANLRFLGPVTPIGGVFLITGWILLAVAAIKKPNNNA